MNVFPFTVLANIVGTCLSNGNRTVPPLAPRGASKLLVQEMPLNSVESLSTALKRLPFPPLTRNSTPWHAVRSNGGSNGMVRMPTNPPLLVLDTVPAQLPLALSNSDDDTPPITTSSSGDQVILGPTPPSSSEPPALQITSPGDTAMAFPPVVRNGFGGRTNLEDWRRKRRTSHGWRVVSACRAVLLLWGVIDVLEADLLVDAEANPDAKCGAIKQTDAVMNRTGATVLRLEKLYMIIQFEIGRTKNGRANYPKLQKDESKKVTAYHTGRSCLYSLELL
mmetsp:Transcript_4974/g.10851  ORF Transcript_4974/g.10851 Transcript_4974/m.10851 type:complete len:279 (+) Transcript_4974:3294-4130(+)